MAIQTVYQKRKSAGKQVFISVFIVTIIVSFLILSFMGFTFMENILISCLVLIGAFGIAIVSTASITTRTTAPQLAAISTNGYTAPTAFSPNSRLYGTRSKLKLTTELNTCKRCGQVMLSGIYTCPKCGWYAAH